jgi:hypothetical protein
VWQRRRREKVCEKNYLNIRLRRLLFIPDVLHNTSHIKKIPQQTIKPQTTCSKRHLQNKLKKTKNRNLSQIVANCQQIAVFFSPFLMVP